MILKEIKFFDGTADGLNIECCEIFLENIHLIANMVKTFQNQFCRFNVRGINSE